jgi:hypothetical protein
VLFRAFPVIDDTHPTALTFAFSGPTHLPATPGTSNEVSSVRVLDQVFLKKSVLIVRQMSRQVLGKRCSFDEDQINIYGRYANDASTSMA